ncbi:MAG: transposase domain-containing protein [Bacteroides xylanisolvens]
MARKRIEPSAIFSIEPQRTSEVTQLSSKNNQLTSGYDSLSQTVEKLTIQKKQKNNVDPYKWLCKVLEVIPTYKVSKLAELLPGNRELD